MRKWYTQIESPGPAREGDAYVRGARREAQGSYSGLPVLARVIKLYMFWGFINMMTCKNSNCPCLSQNVCGIYDILCNTNNRIEKYPKQSKQVYYSQHR